MSHAPPPSVFCHTPPPPPSCFSQFFSVFFSFFLFCFQSHSGALGRGAPPVLITSHGSGGGAHETFRRARRAAVGARAGATLRTQASFFHALPCVLLSLSLWCTLPLFCPCKVYHINVYRMTHTSFLCVFLISDCAGRTRRRGRSRG